MLKPYPQHDVTVLGGRAVRRELGQDEVLRMTHS